MRRRTAIGVGFVLVVIALVIAVRHVSKQAENAAREADARRRLDELLRVTSQPVPARPHAIRPGGRPLDCRTAQRASAALGQLPELDAEEHAQLRAFVASPSKETAEQAFPLLERVEPSLSSLMDSTYCRELSPLAAPEAADQLRRALPLVEAQVAALSWADDVRGALRWTLDLWAVGTDFQAMGGFAEYEAGVEAITVSQSLLDALIAHPQLTKADGVSAAEEVAALLDRDLPPHAVIGRERDRRRVEFLTGPMLPTAVQTWHALDAYERQMSALADAWATPFQQRDQRIRDALSRPTEIERPSPDALIAVDVEAAQAHARGLGQVVAAALEAWRTENATCPADLEALRETLPKQATSEDFGAAVDYEADTCTLRVVDPDGTVLASWQVS